MNILGLSAFYHDSAACLVREGEIIAAAQEERFTRKKHDAGFPEQAARYCLREGGLNVNELDYVTFYEKPFLKFDRILHTYLAYAPVGLRSFLMAIPLWIRERIWMKELIRREFIVDYRPGAGVRISPHFYTKDEELELVIAEMKKIRDGRAYEAGEKAGAAF